jgi:hypothetical protein
MLDGTRGMDLFVRKDVYGCHLLRRDVWRAFKLKVIPSMLDPFYRWTIPENKEKKAMRFMVQWVMIEMATFRFHQTA